MCLSYVFIDLVITVPKYQSINYPFWVRFFEALPNMEIVKIRSFSRNHRRRFRRSGYWPDPNVSPIIPLQMFRLFRNSSENWPTDRPHFVALLQLIEAYIAQTQTLSLQNFRVENDTRISLYQDLDEIGNQVYRQLSAELRRKYPSELADLARMRHRAFRNAHLANKQRFYQRWVHGMPERYRRLQSILEEEDRLQKSLF